jgi:monoamine oxidase
VRVVLALDERRDLVECSSAFREVRRRLDTDFKPAVKLAMARLDYIPAAKVAFRAARRFWEHSTGNGIVHST